MKLSRVLVVGLLVMFAAATSAVVKADSAPGDPVVTIGTSGHDPVASDEGDADNNPVVITDDSGETDITYSGPAVSEFYVEIIPFAGESITTFENELFNCVIGAGATGCGAAPVCTQGQPDANPQCPTSGPAQEFVFFDQDPEGDLVNFITPGEDLVVITPEPGAGILLLVGLGALVGFSLRRRQTSLV